MADDDEDEVVVFAEPPPPDLKCSICLEVFRDPLMTKCGHTFCSRCAFQVSKRSYSAIGLRLQVMRVYVMRLVADRPICFGMMLVLVLSRPRGRTTTADRREQPAVCGLSHRCPIFGAHTEPTCAGTGECGSNEQMAASTDKKIHPVAAVNAAAAAAAAAARAAAGPHGKAGPPHNAMQ